MTRPVLVYPPLMRPGWVSAPDVPPRYVGGVCAGIAYHLAWPAWLVRILVLLATGMCGMGAAGYLLLWGLVPCGDASRAHAAALREAAGRGAASLAESQLLPDADGLQTRRRVGTVGSVLLTAAVGGFLVCVSGAAGLGSILASPHGRFGALFVAVAGGLAIVWSLGSEADLTRPWTLVRGLAGMMIATLSAAFAALAAAREWVGAPGGGLRETIPQLLLVMVVMVAVTVVAVWPLWRILTGMIERTRMRGLEEAARAEVAAHLHDSVLQTLALIRTHASDPVEVASLARTQERELRAWLYEAQPAPGTSLIALVKDRLASVEDRLHTPIEVVTVGDTVPDAFTVPLVDIVAEAATNAVRHGRPPVSVYVEITETQVEAHVMDRGDGFSLDEIDEQRFGVRESIIGRAERLGGRAIVESEPGRCEIAVTLPLARRAE